MNTQSKAWDAHFNKLVNDGIFPHVLDSVLLAGDYRAGKTTLARTLFGKDGIEDVTFHKQILVDDILGSYAPNTNGPGFHWVDGPVARAMRQGKILVINECGHFSGDVRCALHSIMDKPAAVTLSSGERLVAAPGYGVIGTSNDSPESLPHGILDRFDVILRVRGISEGLRRTLGDLADQANAVAGRGVTWEWSRPATVNLFLAAAKLRRHGLKDEAIADTLGLDGTASIDFLAAISTR